MNERPKCNGCETFSWKCRACKRLYDRARYRNNPSVKATIRKYHVSNRGKIAARVKSWKKENPEKARVQQIVHRAFRSGKLQKRPCLVCGVAKVEFHHAWGYASGNELHGIQLCRLHHRRAETQPSYNAELIELHGFVGSI